MSTISTKQFIAGFLAVVLAGFLVGCSSADDSAPEEQPRTVEAGSRVALQYTITDDGGTEVATNIGGDPLAFTVGRDEIFPALEAALEGLIIGDRRQVSLTVEEAYGERDEKAVREVELDMVPEASRVVGAILLADDDRGGQREVTVVELNEETAILDLNHPLAGKALNISVVVVSIEPAESGG